MTPHDILYRIILGVNCFSLFYVITVSTICLIQLISASIGLRQLFFYSFIDNFGYRQLNTVYKVEAMFGFKKNKSRWGELKRKGFSGSNKGTN